MNTPARPSRWPSMVNLLILAVLVTAGAWYGRFGSISVCQHCGARLRTVEWQTPFLPIPLYWHSLEEQTLLSRMLSDEGLISAHRHQWILIHCGGNGICGGTGPGRSLAAAANSEEIAKLIEVTHRFGEVEFRDKLLRTLFDLRTTRAVQYLTIRVPEHGFADRSELRAWIAHEAIEFDDTVGRMQRERR